ncbi:hypothetical protein ACOBQB_00170 [Streptomyces sp. G5(2025)]|uniref:hypothetical protein n=1 Tax=Streptomyces sp. G5(2025) TaxID=3406628 RepID=UPI003C1F465E
MSPRPGAASGGEARPTACRWSGSRTSSWSGRDEALAKGAVVAACMLADAADSTQ